MAGRKLTPAVKRQVESVVAQLCMSAAKERRLPFRRPILAVNGKKCSGDFEVNRHEITVDARKFLSLPVEEMLAFAARILDVYTEFEALRFEERAKEIVRTRSRVLRDLAYLRRAAGEEEEFASILSDILETLEKEE